MEQHLTIRELVMRVADFLGEDRTPFAKTPWTADSEVIWKDGDGIELIIRNNDVFAYFLEPEIIAQVADFVKYETPKSRVDRVIQYAENGA